MGLMMVFNLTPKCVGHSKYKRYGLNIFVIVDHEALQCYHRQVVVQQFGDWARGCEAFIVKN
jgi:hypothetical protein